MLKRKNSRHFAIEKVNQRMVDTCDWLVCYVCHGASNSRDLLGYAQCREKKENTVPEHAPS